MGFKSVYLTLRELFPQVDTRLLKAVAIEHSKDPDSAVEYILAEVLPHSDDKSNAPTSAVENSGKTAVTSNASTSMSRTNFGDGVIASQLNDGLKTTNLDDDSVASPFYDANDSDDQIYGDLRSASTSLKRNRVSNSERGQDERSCTTAGQGEGTIVNNSEALGDLEDVSFGSVQNITDMRVYLSGDASSPSASPEDGDGASDVRGAVEVRFGNAEDVHQDCSNGSPTSDQAQSELNLNAHPEVESDSNIYAANIGEMNNFLNSKLTLEFPDNDGAVAQNETLPSTIMTRSGQICRVNLLEDIIEEAKNYKETVCSAMESVVRLMEEVDHQENEAEQAKVASTRGGLDILEKVGEIKKMLVHAKEANDMHAGEVYGEKSILATEVKELQARLLGLSDEKDKSLSMLEEMRKSLEERLAAAEEQKRAADKVMLDKQEVAQVALAEQELIMDKVVQESKLLQQEAEENAKLRDFLMEKGQVVDVLQGEISVICQDVKLLKENFDNRVSLTKLLSIEKTSSHLASLSSSVKSAASLKSMTSLKSTASLNRTSSLKSTSSSKSTVSLKSNLSDVSDLSIDLMKFPESPKRMIRALSGEYEDGNRDVEEKFVSYEATAQKPLLDEDWELCDMI